MSVRHMLHVKAVIQSFSFCFVVMEIACIVFANRLKRGVFVKT